MKRSSRNMFMFIVLMLVVSLACSTFGAPPDTEDTAQQPATQAPVAEPVENTAVPEPAISPTEETAVLGDAYTHKTGAFSVTPPKDWKEEEGTASVSFTSADEVGLISLAFTNTGYELDSVSFENFVVGNEQNRFMYYENYSESRREGSAASGELTVFKTFDLNGGKTQSVFTRYIQAENIIYAFDFWADDAQSEKYADLFETVSVNITFNAQAVKDFDPYNFIYTFTSASKMFTLEVPTPWIYSYNEDGDVIAETFTSPDQNAFIESIIYNDGSAQTPGVAGKATLYLLNNLYTNGGGDIKVTEDKIMPDKSERLTWTSQKGNYSGMTFFEVRDGKTILILSTVTHNDFIDLYSPLFDYTLGTYTNQ